MKDDIFTNCDNNNPSNPYKSSKAVRNFLRKDLIRTNNLVQVLLISDSDQTSHDRIIPINKLEGVVRRLYNNGIKNFKVFVHQSIDKPLHLLVDDNLSLTAIHIMKRMYSDICIITDCCLCSFDKNGNCCIEKQKAISYQESIDLITKLALNQVRAGADMIGPAAMMDGLIFSIKNALKKNGFGSTAVVPHLTFRSNLFRSYRKHMETGCGEQRQLFQTDPSREDIYLKTAKDFSSEGADMLMMQPIMFSMDQINKVKNVVDIPVGVFSVLGEYDILQSFMGNKRDIMLEYSNALYRSGADFIVTYGANDIIQDSEDLYILEKS
jgi:porphobilinogen synthase